MMAYYRETEEVICWVKEPFRGNSTHSILGSSKMSLPLAKDDVKDIESARTSDYCNTKNGDFTAENGPQYNEVSGSYS